MINIADIVIPPGYKLVAVAEVDIPVLRALSALWSDIREQTDGIPPATFDLQPTRPSSCGTVEWSTAPVIVLNLRDANSKTVAARDVLFTLLHLAAHAAVAGGSATSEGRYHSASFADAAGKLGLDVSTERVAGIGYKPEGLARGTLKRYDNVLRQLGNALKAWTPEVVRQRQRSPLVFACQCQPPRKIWMHGGTAAKGGIICAVCGQPFQPANAS